MEENLNNKDNRIRGAIVKTVAFFDIFDFPLTGAEIWRFCDYRCELADVINFLDSSADFLEKSDGYYFLPGRSDLCGLRKAKILLAEKKYKKVSRIVRLFSFIPWIKMVAISNIIGQDNVKEDSDIDLFIITEKGRIWITRFATVVTVKLLGLRPRPNNVKDKICLSFFVSTENLDLKKLMMFDDVYFYHWLANLMPVYGQSDHYRSLIGENGWLLEKMPNWSIVEVSDDLKIRSDNSVFYHDLVDLFFGGLEVNFKKYQLKVMSPTLKKLMNKDTRVVVNDGVLKLISNDRRTYYRDLYLKKIKELM